MSEDDTQNSNRIIMIDGTQEWRQNGELHRDNDLPAVIRLNGIQEWYSSIRYWNGNM